MVLPGLVAEYAGDTLWALAAFLGLRMLMPRMRTRWVAAGALLVSALVELSQLYHAPWIDRLRQTVLGGLVLGFGFLWSDLLCYLVGVTAGVVLDWVYLDSPARSPGTRQSTRE